MAKPRPFLARILRPEVNTGTALAPVWVAIEGLDSVTITNAETSADTSDFDDEGWGSSIVAMRNQTVMLAGKSKMDPVTRAPMPGQAFVEALGEIVGDGGYGDFRITRPSGSRRRFEAVVKCDPYGGGIGEASKWTAELKTNGKPVTEPAPVGP